MKKRTTGMIKKLTSLMLAGALVFTPLGSIQGNAVSAAVSNVESAQLDISEENIADTDNDGSLNNEETEDKTGSKDKLQISDVGNADAVEEAVGNASGTDSVSDEVESGNDEESDQADSGNDDNDAGDKENMLDQGTANDAKEDIAEQELNEEVKEKTEVEPQTSEAFNEFKIVDGVGVSVSAPEDVFPNGSKLSVKSLKSGSVFNNIKDYLEYARPENKKSVLKYIIDVRAYKDSEDISGDINGEIKLSFLIRDTRITEITSVNVYKYDKYWGFTSVDDADATIEDYPLLATHTELDTENVTCVSVNADSLAYYVIEFTEEMTEEDYWTLTLDYGDAIVWQENGGAYYYIKENGEYGKTRNKEDALRNAHRFAEIKVPKGIEKDVNVRFPIYATEVNGIMSVFNGWQNEDGTVYNKYMFENYMPTSNEKYTAQWNTDLCKVTMDYGEIAPIWRDDNDYTYYFDETGNVSGTYDPDEAKRKANTFSIQYYRMGEKFQTNPDKVRKNTVIEFDGTEYRIESWENEDGIKIENVNEYVPTSDVTLHAIWTDKLCHVTIYQDASYSCSYTLIQGEQLKNYPIRSEIWGFNGKKYHILKMKEEKNIHMMN